MSTQNKCRLTANAGILVELGGVKILVDALHDIETVRFSPVSERVQQMMILGQPPFDDVDYFLVTHYHNDHYSRQLMAEWIKHNEQATVITAARDFLPNEKMIVLGSADETFYFPNLKIRAKKILHAGEEYYNVANYGFFCENESGSFAVLGDAEFLSAEIGDLFEKEADAAFLNFPYLTMRRGRDVIADAVKAKQIFYYHLPFREKDSHSYFDMTQRFLNKHSELPPAKLLISELQTEVF